MFQLAVPAIKVAAPFIIKGAILAGGYLAANTAVAWTILRSREAGKDSAVKVEKPKVTFGQKVKREMLFFGKVTWEVTKYLGVPALLLGGAIACTTAFPVLAGALSIAGVIYVIGRVEMDKHYIARTIKRVARGVRRFFTGVAHRLSAAWKALRSTKDDWADIVLETEEQVDAMFPEHEVVAEDQPVFGVNVDEGINANFDEMADEDEEAERLSFESRLILITATLHVADFRSNTEQATADYINQLPRDPQSLKQGYDALREWLSAAELTGRQRSRAVTTYQRLRSERMQQAA